MSYIKNLLFKFNDFEVPDGLKKFMSELTSSAESFFRKITGSGMTGAEIQASDRSLANQQILNEEEFDRKVDFYERFESPSALVRQYKEAGLNPMLLAGSGASVSASGGVGAAGSAPAHTSSGDALGGILGSVLGYLTKTKQIQQDALLRGDANDINRYEAETRRLQTENYGKYLDALTIGQNQKNDVFYQAFGLDMQGKEADIKAKEAQAQYLNEVAGSETVRRSLMQSGIRLNDSVTAINEIQKAIIKAQEKYSDKYFKAVADISAAQATIEGISANVESKLAEKGKEFQYNARVAECADMIFRAGMDLDIWEGDAFKNSVAGTMTKKDWTQTVTSLLKTLLGAGAVVGAAGLRAGARAVVPPSPWSPQQQYQFYGSTGYRFDSSM